ncbi:MAG TPA: class I SAM-dependent methyltransferase [Gemmataceae bacterium]|nr:class I SAM-dependent methyltransferase [Gemmataceae bacterium]
MSNGVAIPLACRPGLLMSPLPGGGSDRYAVKDLRTGDCYTLGGPEYFLLGRLDGGQTAGDLSRAFQDRFGEDLSEGEVHEFVELAQARGFLEPVAAGAAPAAGGRIDGDVACQYDEVPYHSRPFPQTHPDHLATVATFFGMQPPPVDSCRVLELGCAAGGNLIPMAATLPGARFVGIDLSGRQIDDGRRVVKCLGLRNIELRRLSILDVGPELGEFDYIVCHGVFSWVPAAVRDKILAVCAERLAPNGVAFVSYNTYPGWHLPGVVRAMMRFHAERFAEPAVRVRQARAVLEFLAAANPPENDGYGGGLHKELELLRTVPDHYLFHEYLEEENHPVYFHEFNAQAEGHGLQYLGESSFLEMLTDHLAPGVANTLRLLAPDLVQTEQYLDFLRNRRFRQTLLCRQGVSLHRAPAPERLERLYVASGFRPVSADPDLGPGAVEEFRTPRGLSVTTGDPLVKAALVHLAEAWPGAVLVRALPAAALARLGRDAGPDAADTRLLLPSLLKCATPGAVEFRLTPPRLVATLSDRPRASALARFQAATGAPVVSLRHQVVPVDAPDRRVLRLLDGSRDRGQLLRDLGDSTDAGLSAEALEDCLGRLARHALLEK